jgi:PAS domain S-box-containing protein/putative nucleotidyltransferase with HDIG domain
MPITISRKDFSGLCPYCRSFRVDKDESRHRSKKTEDSSQSSASIASVWYCYECARFFIVIRQLAQYKDGGDKMRTTKLYRDLVEEAGLAISIDDKEGKPKYFNNKYAATFGYARSDMEKQSLRTLVHPDDVEMVLNYHQGRVAGNYAPARYEVRGLKKDGTVIYLDVAAVPLKDKNGIAGTRAYLWDISERKQLENKLNSTLKALRKTTGTMVQVIERMLEIRDPYTVNHQQRVADLARAIAGELGLSTDRVDGLRLAGLIHDIGKIAIPAEILSKPTRLSDVELQMIRTHPKIGYDLIKSIELPWPVAMTVLQHHERLDGSGYPLGISGNEILLEAKILGVADVIEAMSSHRPYRPALGMAKALEEISQHIGVLYDKDVVEACLKVLQQNGFGFRYEGTPAPNPEATQEGH